jgi:hypothetical protein
MLQPSRWDLKLKDCLEFSSVKKNNSKKLKNLLEFVGNKNVNNNGS